jgi:NDP-sugar pyrophosphorylase family protein
MVSAILMAGYNNKREVKRYAKMVAEHYGEKFIETGYKPLREFKAVEDGREISKPLIQYTLERLLECHGIGEIVIVGHQMLLEQRMGDFLSRSQKPCAIVNQNSKIPHDVIKRFDIIPKKVKHNSVAGNLIKGYASSKACGEKKHALFLASDSPLTSIEFIEDFLNLVQKCEKKTAALFPTILVDSARDKLGRLPLKLHNDTKFKLPGKKDSFGRQGFRLSSVMMANPHLFNINRANTAYGLRKLISPNIQLQLFKITHNLGYANVFSKYFIRKDLTIREVENIISAYFEGHIRIIPMLGEETTYDYDGTELEYRMINDMLKSD